MTTRATISARSTLLQIKKNEVTPRAKMKGLVRKVIDSSSWLAPILKEFRTPQKERTDPHWLTLKERVCLLQREEDREYEVIESLTDKLEVLVAFMDYDRDTVRKLALVGRFVAFGSGRTIVEKGREPRTAYLILSGEVSLLNEETPPLVFQVLGHVKRVGHLKLTEPPKIKDNLKYKRTEDMFGDMEIITGKKRPATVSPSGVVELMCFEKRDLLDILSSKIEVWKNIKDDLNSYRLFSYLNEDTLFEIVKFGQYESYQPNHCMNITFREGSVPDKCYFLIEGCCEVLQRLLIARDDGMVGFERFKLYYWQEQKLYPDWIEPVYMRACRLDSGAFFGFGERLCKQHILTVTNCQFLTLPSELIAAIKDKLHAYQESMDLLDDVFPSTIDLFLSYVSGRFWKDYVRKTIRNSKKRRSNDNNIHDVPLTWRADRLKFHHPGWEKAISNHPDFNPTQNVQSLLKVLEEGRKRREDLAEKREHVFSVYRTRDSN